MEVENPRWRSVKTIDALYNKLPGHAAPAGVVAKARAAAAAAIRGLRECQECRAETRAASGVTKDLQVCPSRRGRQTLERYCSHSLGGLVGRTNRPKLKITYIFHCNHTCAPDSFSYRYILQAHVYYYLGREFDYHWLGALGGNALLASVHDGKGWVVANEGKIHGTGENIAEEDLALASMGNLEGAL